MIRSLAVAAGLIVVTTPAAAQGILNHRWIKLGAGLRGRAEGYRGNDFIPRSDEVYYLHRLRLDLAIEPRSWLKFFVEAQDSRVAGYPGRAPSSVVNPVDLRQGYVEAGSVARQGWAIRAGRQELAFGDERLVGPSNWGNVARTFDAVRISYGRSRVRLDWFASSVVMPDRDQFDRLRTAGKFHGFHCSFDRLPQETVIQPYFFWKSNTQALDERGQGGDLDVYTAGIRGTGRLGRRFDYGVEAAVQGGHAAGDAIRAWAGHWRAGYSLWDGDGAPRVVGEYNYASGDRRRGDGRRGTFDQLYPTNHSKYGIADRAGWRNIHDGMAGVEWKPSAKWKLNADHHAFWLATRNDVLYNASGIPTVSNSRATSSHVGNEIDLQVSRQINKNLQCGFGYARLIAGAYLKESTSGGSFTFTYVTWEYKF